MPDAGACVSYLPVYGLSVPFSRRTRNCSADAYAVSFACCTTSHQAPGGGGLGLRGAAGRDENDGITTKIYLWKEQLAIHPHFSAQGKRRTCLLFLPR